MSLEQAKAMMQQYYAQSPADRKKYALLELMHSAFVADDGTQGVWRIVSGRAEPLVVTLPTGAKAQFEPVAMEVKPPKKNVRGRRDVELVIDGVSRKIMEQLERQAEAPREPIRANFYEYRDDYLDAPGEIFEGLTVESPQCSAGRVTAKLTYTDSNNQKIPSVKYTLSTHPGLAE